MSNGQELIECRLVLLGNNKANINFDTLKRSNRLYLRYTAADFQLLQGVEILRISTESNGEVNRLGTKTERKTIVHDQEAKVTYNRMTHEDFEYKILIRNNRGYKARKKKIIVRLWLGLLKRKNDIR